MTTFTLQPAGPYSLRATIDPGRPHLAPCARDWRRCGARLVIAFPLDGTFEPAAVALGEEGGAVVADLAGTDDVATASRQVARMLSLDHDGSGLAAVAERDPVAARALSAEPGRRPINFQSPYHKAVWGVLCAGISMRGATVLQQRIVDAAGGRVEIAGGTHGTLPHPARLRELEPADVPGVPAERLLRLRGVAEAALQGRLDADRLRAMGRDAAVADLLRIRGVGPWTAAGIYCRGAAPVDEVTPEEPRVLADVGNAYGLGRPATEAEYRDIAELWRPYRMWLTFLVRAVAPTGAGGPGRVVGGEPDRPSLRPRRGAARARSSAHAGTAAR